MKKGSRTKPQAEIRAEKRDRAQRMRAWLSERVAAAQLRKREAQKDAVPPAPGTGVPPVGVLRDQGAHGKTLVLKAIKSPEPEWLVRHEHANNTTRRHRGKAGTGSNVVYINPARDLKPGRRLR